ncbi:MAG TPA: SMI1/KNR4 family protein [Kofleriaceae bacterium]|nr:SMI1/KNR4 family protein [Kofleriaceae bacterium]
MDWTERLRQFVERWYAAPIRTGDGNSESEIIAVERDLGDQLPESLRAWYRLVGKRLEPVQDEAITLELLAARREWLEHPAAVPVWHENQGVWTLAAPLGRAADPPAILEDDVLEWPGGAVSEALFGMAVSETLVARGNGVFGAIGGAVTSGYVEDTSDEHDAAIRAALPRLPWVPNPFFAADGYRGDESLVALFIGSGWTWMASDTDALERARFVLRLEAVETFRLEIWISNLTPAEHAVFRDDWDLVGRLQDLVGGLGHVGSYTLGKTQVDLTITTKNPDGVFAHLRGAFPAQLEDRLVIAYARESIARYTVLHPPGLTDWSPPRGHL